jgi:hypothetical protein
MPNVSPTASGSLTPPTDAQQGRWFSSTCCVANSIPGSIRVDPRMFRLERVYITET